MRSIVERTGPRPGPHRRRHLRRRQPGRRGQPQRRALRRAARRLPVDRARRDRQPPVRLVGRGRHPGQPRDRDRRRRHHARRRRRVDEPRAVRGREGRRSRSRAGNQTMWNTSIGWRMVNPQLRKDWTISQRRDRREARAALRHHRARSRTPSPLRSHRLAAAAWAAGVYDGEIVQVEGHELARDEGIRDDTTRRDARPG